MRIYDAATSAALVARDGIISQRLIWIEARNTATGLPEHMGVWTGDYDLAVPIDGEARTYQGLGAVLQAEPISAAPGLAVRIHQLRLAAVAPEVEDLVKGYDTRFAPVEIHRALFYPETRGLIGDPHRVYRGLINDIVFPRSEPGGNPECIVSVASETRVLTRALASKKSDESHKVRGGDRFRKYADISGNVPVFWGEAKLAAAGMPATAAPNTATSRPRTDQHGNIIYLGR